MIFFLPLFADLLQGQTGGAAPLSWRLRWIWNWPPWVTVLTLIATIAWVTILYFRETSTAGKPIRLLMSALRLTAFALTLLMLAQPAIEWFHLSQPRLVLLVDRSASMSTTDRYPGSNADVSRLAICQKTLTGGPQPPLAQWQSDYQVEVIAFDERIEPLVGSRISVLEQLQTLQTTDKKSAGGTRLGDAIDYVLRELPGKRPVAILVVTDGVVTQGQSLQQVAQRARLLRVPLYTVAVGSDRRRPDIALENLRVEEIVFPGDRLQVEATVRATGYEGKKVEVLLQETVADAPHSQILARTTLELPADKTTQTVRWTIGLTEPGQRTLELLIEPREEETDTDNNRVRQVIEVRDEKIRVLFVQSQPSYEYRALKSLLERDPAVELRVVLQEADADYSSVDHTALRAFPASEQALLSYDVLILGDVDPDLLPRSAWPLVERFVVEHGGGLVGIAGPRFMPQAYRGIRPLELLLPVQFDSFNSLHGPLSDPLGSQRDFTETFSISPTELGWKTPSLQLGDTRKESHRIWQALPPLSWMLRVENVKPGVQILAETQKMTNGQGKRLPVIMRHYVGAGEVLMHATDETWRWRWRTDDRYFAVTGGKWCDAWDADVSPLAGKESK